MCYPALNKDHGLGVLVFSPLSFAYLASHTPAHYKIILYDEYVGERLDPVKHSIKFRHFTKSGLASF